jgi:putative copper resistance protein D
LDTLPPLDALILWVHLISAVLFVGGSFFMWLVVMPASRSFAQDESERTQTVGMIAKRFGRLTAPILVVLVLTGVYNASWYLPSPGALFTTPGGGVLLAKSALVVALFVLIYLHNVYFGRRIIQLARENKLDELKALRRRSRVVSFANLTLMVVILLLAVMLQMPF